MGGSRVGQWEVLGELARGGQGVVLRARHAAHGTPAALKLLLRVELKTVLRFRQEAAVLLRLNHPNLVRVLEVGEHEGAPFLAMELVVGQSLADLVREGGPPPFERTAKLLAAVARAVHHCHASGVVHRDLKPENVIVERDTGRAVLVDFGMVKRDRELFGALSIDELTRLSRTGELRGTPMYMAPEQVTSQGEVGPWTDVHALGAMLHVLLTGEPPYAADSLPGVVHAILAQPPEDPRTANPAVPAALARLCLAARAKDRAARPRSAAAFAAALEASAGASRGSGLAVAVAVGLVVVGGAAAGAVAARRRPEAPAPLAPTPASIAPTPSAGPAPVASEGAADLVERALALLEAEPARALALAEEALAVDPGALRARGARGVARLFLARRSEAGASDEALEEVVASDPSLGWARGQDGAPDPRLLDAWTIRSGRRYMADDLAGALEDVGLVLAARPDDPWALMYRARVLLQQGDAAGALVDLERVLARAKGRALPWRMRAEARLQRYDPRGALADLAEARAREPADVDQLCTGARALAQLGDHEGAIRELGRLLGQAGCEEVDVRLYRASELVEVDRLPAALADVDAVLRLVPGNQTALAIRGALRWRSGERDLAAADFAAGDAAMAELEPGARAALHEDRARRRRRAGDLEGALADADQAVAIAPSWTRGRAMRGAALLGLGRPAEALVECDAVVAAEPDSVVARTERARVHQLLGRHADAIADLGRALAVGGADPRIHLARSTSHLALGDPAAAVADATRSVELAPDDGGAWHGLGLARRAAKDDAGALQAFDRAIQLFGETEAAGPSLQHRATCRRVARDFPAALADLERATRLRPGWWGGWHDLGLTRGLAGDAAGAIEAYGRAIELATGKDLATSLAARAALRRAADDLPGALADFDRAIELAPERWALWNDRGSARQRSKDLAGALADYDRAIELAPDQLLPWRNRSAVRRARQEWDAAEADLERALAVDPRDGPSLASRGWLRQRRGAFAPALEDLDRAIELGTDLVGNLRVRASVRRDLGDVEGALADLGLALAKDPRATQALLARSYLRREWCRDLDGALADEEAALAVDPQALTAWRYRALTRLLRGDAAGARADADEGVRLAPSSVDALATRARVRAALGDPAGARADAERALAIEPASQVALWVQGVALLAGGDAPGAVAACTSSIEVNARAPRALATRAEALATLGRPAEALADLDRALTLEPGRPDPLLQRAALRERSGDRAGAAADLRDALALLRRDDPRRAAASAALARLE